MPVLLGSQACTERVHFTGMKDDSRTLQVPPPLQIQAPGRGVQGRASAEEWEAQPGRQLILGDSLCGEIPAPETGCSCVARTLS